jgi:hypothetical protein
MAVVAAGAVAAVGAAVIVAEIAATVATAGKQAFRI